MDGRDILHEMKCYGSTTVSPRGQMVIPSHARKELGIDTGDTLLVFLGPGRRGLLLLKADTVEQILSMVSEQLASIGKLLKSDVLSGVAGGNSQEEGNEKED